MRRVVVTGVGAVTPCGLDAPSTWDAMCAGRSGIATITRYDASHHAVRIAGEVKGFDAAAVVGPHVARRTGRFIQLAVAAAREALRDAGLGAPHAPAAERMGVSVGSGIGGLPEIADEAVIAHEKGQKRVSAFFIPSVLPNLAAGIVAIEVGARGPTIAFSTACAAGNHSIGEAWHALRRGEADVMLAGGAEAAISPLGLGGFLAMRALSRRNDDPATASRPFDADRDGFVFAEGAGIVVLEGLDHALARGAPILAELVGYGSTTDAHHVTAPAPDGEGAVRCMRLALQSAGVRAEDVQHVNAHGTSTSLNDAAETGALREVFGAHADRLAVSSTKGVTGHMLGAAGGVEAVATVCAIRDAIVPPTANLATPDPACDLDYVAEGSRSLDVRVALSNAFGFGGVNATLVFRRYEE